MSSRYWLFVILSIALTTAVSVVTYRTSILLRHWKPDRNLLLLPGENIVRLALIAVCIGLGHLSGLPADQLGWSFAAWQADLVEGLIWGLLMAGAIYLVTQWIIARFGERYYSRTVVDAILPRNRNELAWMALAMISVVVAEELLFRSLLLGGLRPLLGWPVLLVITSAVFGVQHLPQGRWGVAGAALAGALLGLLFLKTGSLVAPVAAHYVTNMAQIAHAMRVESRSKIKESGNLDG